MATTDLDFSDFSHDGRVSRPGRLRLIAGLSRRERPKRPRQPRGLAFSVFLRVFAALIVIGGVILGTVSVLAELQNRARIEAGLRDAVAALSVSLARASAEGNSLVLEMQMDRLGATEGIAYAAFQDPANLLRRSRRFPDELHAIPLDDPLQAALVPYQILTACSELSVLPLDRQSGGLRHSARLAICTQPEPLLISGKMALNASVLMIGVALLLGLLTALVVARLIAARLAALHEVLATPDKGTVAGTNLSTLWQRLDSAAEQRRAEASVLNAAFHYQGHALVIADQSFRIRRASLTLVEMLPELADINLDAQPVLPLAPVVLDAVQRDGHAEFKTSLGRVLEMTALSPDGEDGDRMFLLRDGSDAQKQGIADVESRRMITRLASGIAHDINNMLAAIQGNAELLLAAGTLDEADCSALMTIIEASQGGAMLTRDLLSFAGHQTLRPEALRIDSVIDDVMRSTSPALPDSVQIARSSTLPGVVQADRFFLKTALSHLIFNASDAIKNAGEIQIRSEEEVHDGAHYVALWIEDRGTGMTAEVLARASEPFFTTKRLGKGRGLGLPMASGFAKQSGGWMDISSTPEEGTRVKLVLPALAEESATPPHAEAAADKARSQSVILLDADKASREKSLKLLDQLGHKAVSVQSPEGFLMVAPKLLSECDAILCDSAHCIETLRHMRSMAKEIPLILLAEAGAETRLRVSAIARGRIVLAKPLNEAALTAALVELTEPRQSRDQVLTLRDLGARPSSDRADQSRNKHGNGG